jgi:NADH-quinone oxidoreductase subunit C
MTSAISRYSISRHELDVRFLADITSVDWLGHEREKDGRFEVAYNLYSIKNTHRFFLKVHLPADNPEIASLTHLWEGANWLEREVWDLMGITFTGHPDLTKILTPDDLEGHPLRRDFPLTWEQPRFSWNKDNPPEVIK